MINLRSVYSNSEERAPRQIGVLFLLLIGLIFLQSVFSPTFVFATIVSVTAVAVSFKRPLWILSALAVYLPFETVFLKFVPDDAYFFARYFSESLIYLVASFVLWQLVSGKMKWEKTKFNLPFVLFVGSLAISILVNFVPSSIAILGARQILRFIIVFFLVIFLKPSKRFIKQLTIALFTILIATSALGIVQSLVGESLDLFLLSSEARTFGSLTLTEGVRQFWEPGSRVFATFGRYDRFGNFLYIFLLIATGFLFVKQRGKQLSAYLPWVFLAGLPALLMTQSRASWFAFLIGFFFISLIIRRDKRAKLALFALIVMTFLLISTSGLHVRLITEAPGQNLTERFLETFSYSRFRGEYYGLGRVFWFVHTPLDVVTASPVFGWGPGQFGSGTVSALHNTRVYDALGLPFGVFDTEGIIDNNWFSLWGEVGTLGMIFYLWLFIMLFQTSLSCYRDSKEPFTRALALGFMAVWIAVAFNAFTSTLFEIRTLAFYFWLYAGFVAVLYNGTSAKVRIRATCGTERDFRRGP